MHPDAGRQIQVLVQEEGLSNGVESWTTVRLCKLEPSKFY